ncbi:hypothetical protein phiL_094 [Escherichia phage LAMP]|uniref:Uncharacterized protein n=1 Tax=Escherichia phage LAMP TaxID=2065191 RepID=A0A2I6PD69_9CAUD|nr:hypothetical protein phiL_094 [Escherichia phage LAMP]
MRPKAYSYDDMINQKGFGQRQSDGSIIWFVNGQKKVAK